MSDDDVIQPASRQTLVNGRDEGVVVRAANGEILMANNAALRMLDMSTDDLPAGRPQDPRWGALREDGTELPPDEWPALAALATGEAVIGTTIGIRHRDGSRVWLDVNAYPMRSDDGCICGVATSFRDRTERHAAEDAMRFQAVVLSAIGQAVIAADPLGRIVFWNDAAASTFGWTADEAVGRLIEDVTGLTTESTAHTDFAQALHKDGLTFPVLVTTAPVNGDDGELHVVISASTDVSALKKFDEAARLLSAIVESSADAICSVSPAGEITTWNAAAEALYGYSAREAVGAPVMMLVPADRHDEVRANLANIARGAPINVETVGRHKDGSELQLSLTISPVMDADGNVVASSAIARDISQQLAMQRQLEHQAFHDELTGLPNRALLTDRLQRALVRAGLTGGPVAVLFVDVDHFKLINDAVGHTAGDEVLVEVATRLAAAVCPTATVARFGGDAFVIVCEGASAMDAEDLAHRVEDALAAPIEVAGRPMHVTASIGIAMTPAEDADQLLSRADAAMYDAKARGRARASVFDAKIDARVHEQMQLSMALRDAIDHDQLEVHYQPIVDLNSSAVIGVEALCRWNHPTFGHVPPVQFIRVAEETGLISALDRWVLRRATADARVLRESGVLRDDSRMAVNISARNVADAGLEQAVREAVGAAGIPYDALALEVTETGVMADPDGACTVLSALEALGIRIKLDDFGTGHSSLTYLRRLPIGAIKIDQTFVADILDDPDDLAIVVSIIELARSVHVATIAEGIETPEQMALLRRLGCWAGQGYLWSPALSRDELISTVRAHRGGRLVTITPPSWNRRRRSEPDVTVEHGLSRLMQLHHAGASLTSIAAALNLEGFRTPAGHRWHPITVGRTISDAIGTAFRPAGFSAGAR